MVKKSTTKTIICSFCGKSNEEVIKLIAGNSANICNECVEVCYGLVQEEMKTNDSFSESLLSCPSCKSNNVGGLQVSFLWFEDNKFDLDSVLEESFNTRYFNSLSCNDCDSDIFDDPSSYFLDTNKICDQYEADEQIALLKESLEKKNWSGEILYLIVNKGFIVFSDTGLEDVSTLSKRILSEKDFSASSYYTGDKIKQDKVYKIKELNEDMILQQSE